MRKPMLYAVIVAMLTGGTALGQWTPEQLNTLNTSSWDFVRADKKIRIEESNATQAFVFRATYGTDPDNDPLDEIWSIELGVGVTEGTVTLMMAGDTGCTLPGATNVKKIAIDPYDVTSIIECINITGDFLETSAMTVDQVTGAMRFGDPDDGSAAGLLNAITVNGDLDGTC